MMGKVYLTGAGPGDPKLITVRGLETIREADVIVYDRLASEALLQEARPGAQLIDVGKASGNHSLPQDDINALLVELASRNRVVTRLKGGDPFVFGRGGEEALALAEEGIPFEVVPGISSSVAVPASAGIPVTHRGLAASFAVVTGHECGPESSGVDWAWAAGASSLVVLMGLKNLPEIVRQLTGHGKMLDTPIALIQQGTTEGQRTVIGTLGTIEADAQAAGLSSPVTIIIGDTVPLGRVLGTGSELRATP